jgi:hypothetical protein
MKIEKKIEKWCMDARFVDYANRRLNEKAAEGLEYGRYDALFEEMDEAFDYDDRYIVPLVEYLTCRLHLAKLYRNAKKRERDIWWVWQQVALEGYYVQVFSEYFAPLLAELKTTLMPMLYKEYISRDFNKEG